MDETESLRDQLFNANWKAEDKLRGTYRWGGPTRDNPTAVSWERGGNYDPLRPDEWHALIGKMLTSIRILDTPLNRTMFDDFTDIHSLSAQLVHIGITYDHITPRFYVHGQYRRYEVKQHENGSLEVLSSQVYNGTF